MLFCSRFMQNSAWARTHARSATRDFYVAIFGPHSSLWKRSTIYAKICIHLRWFRSYFTQKSIWARTRAPSDVHDFYAIIFWPHSSLWNRSTIYAKICTHLRWFGSRFTLKSHTIIPYIVKELPKLLSTIWFIKFNVNDNDNDLHSITSGNKFE